MSFFCGIQAKQDLNSSETSCEKSKGKEEMLKYPFHRWNQEPGGYNLCSPQTAVFARQKRAKL
jgi:hypothetical protein